MPIITIDGPVATGKSTIAKRLAHHLGFIYFDTGAMYRCLTWKALKEDIPLADHKQLHQLAKTFHFDIALIEEKPHYFVDNQDVTSEIRDRIVTAAVSEVSAIPEIRVELVKRQQQLASGHNAVVEGRDMGTVVFPNADVKFFLTGKDEIRAKRRYDELCSLFPEKKESVTLEMILQELKARDAYDTNRTHSPLKQADDAILIDTSDLSLDEVVESMLAHLPPQYHL